MINRYSITIYTPQEYNHSSYLQTGLFELEKQGMLDIDIKLSLQYRKGKYRIENDSLIKTNEYSPKTSFYKLLDRLTNTETMFACDLYDLDNHFSSYALENYDYIFKRNYVKENIDHLPELYRNKVLRLGLTFGVHSDVHKGFLKFFLANYIGAVYWNLKWDKRILKRIFNSLQKAHNHWRHIRTSRKISLFDSKTKPISSTQTILFQTRCFNSSTDPDVLAIHEQRYDIIRLLKKEFPKLFKGGFVSSKMSELNYSDAITNITSDPVSYLNAVKESSIVIYTRGLKNSPAWKMAEYCSQGKIIIAERLTAELPDELIDGKHVLFFDGYEELVEKINLVLKSKRLRDTLSFNAREYYLNTIHPRQNVRRILKIMRCHL
jgi:glycosyltransferase involved in cell wall biosynthesis